MQFDWFTWFRIIITILSLIGVWLNIKRKAICFVIWMFTNAAWTIVDFKFKIYEQAFLFFIYFLLAIYGVYEWKLKTIIKEWSDKKQMKQTRE